MVRMPHRKADYEHLEESIRQLLALEVLQFDVILHAHASGVSLLAQRQQQQEQQPAANTAKQRRLAAKRTMCHSASPISSDSLTRASQLQPAHVDACDARRHHSGLPRHNARAERRGRRFVDRRLFSGACPEPSACRQYVSSGSPGRQLEEVGRLGSK
jgi:hypothetical protein